MSASSGIVGFLVGVYSALVAVLTWRQVEQFPVAVPFQEALVHEAAWAPTLAFVWVSRSIMEIKGGNVMVAAKSSRVNRQDKKKYRIRNWREYERGLRSRGDVTIWLSEEALVHESP